MSNVILDNFLDDFPANWSRGHDYEKNLFIRVKLDESDEEYKNIEKIFVDKGNMTPTKIERVQYPLAYMRYCIQSEYLENENTSFIDEKAYVKIQSADVETYLSYNCDNRVISTSPCMDSSVPSAVSAGENVVVVVKRSYTVIETDKNHYPAYVVEF